MCFSPNRGEIGYEWEMYHNEDEDNGAEAGLPPLPRSTSPTPSQPPSEALSEASQASCTSQDSSKGGTYSIGSRIQAIPLLEIGMPIEQITAFIHIKKSRIYSLCAETVRRRWDPRVSKIVEVRHVEDAKRSSQPKTSQVVIDLIVATVTKNSITGGWSCSQTAFSVSETPGIQPVSASTVYRVLTAEGSSTYKRTVKPDLTKEQKDARLKWCLERKECRRDRPKIVVHEDSAASYKSRY
jgi:hypothetical protein